MASLENEQLEREVVVDGDALTAEFVGRSQRLQLDSALLRACSAGNPDAVELLLDRGANPNHTDCHGTPVLVRAATGSASGEAILVSFLLHGADYHSCPIEGKSVPIWACSKGHVQVVRTLVEDRDEAMDEQEPNSAGHFPIHIAAILGYPQLLDYLISGAGCRVDMVDQNGCTPLHYACTEGGNEYRSMMQCLISANADLMLPTSVDQASKTPLEVAFDSGRLAQFVDLLTLEDVLLLAVQIDDIVPVVRPAAGGSLISKKAPRMSLQLAFDKDAVWRRILQNDDTELLKKYRDSRIWRTGGRGGETFEEAQGCSTKGASLFDSCFENGLGVYSMVEAKFREQIDRGHFKTIVLQLAGLTQFKETAADADEATSDILPSPSASLALLALLCGRLKVSDLLLRMRQFDLVSMALLCVLIARRLTGEENSSPLPPHGVRQLNAYAEALESLATDAVSSIYLTDKSTGKRDSLNSIDQSRLCYGPDTAWIDLADRACCTNFLSLQCCQEVLNKRWYGRLLRPLHPLWRIVCILCPLAYIIASWKRTKEHKPTEVSGPGATWYFFGPGRGQGRQLGGPTINNLRLIHGILSAPFAKFFLCSLFHCLFLLLYSYVLLFEFNLTVSRAELFCNLFLLGCAVQEVRQIYRSLRKSRLRLVNAVNARNWLDLAALLLIGCSIAVRFVGADRDRKFNSQYEEAHDTVLYAARVLAVTGLLLFYIRILFIASPSAVLGPKLKMMTSMLFNDLLPLLLLFLIFMMAFGIVFQGLLYPNSYPVGAKSPLANTSRIGLQRAIYGMFVADYFLDELQCSPIEVNCPHTWGTGLVLYFYNVIYIFIVNIMLINLLIALFSNTVARIDQRSREHWLADRYSLIEVYKELSLLPSPANIVCVLCEIAANLVRRLASKWPHQLAPGSDRRSKDPLLRMLKRHISIQMIALKGHRYSLGSNSSNTKTGDDGVISTSYGVMETSVNQVMRTWETHLRSVEVKLRKVCDLAEKFKYLPTLKPFATQ